MIIPTYQREDDLVRTIQSVLEQPVDVEILVIDQTTTHSPATEEYLCSIEDPRFNYHLVEPPSLTAARNYGVERSSGDIVIFIDDDVELREDFVLAHLRAYEDEAVGAVAGRVIGPTEPMDSRPAYIAWTGFREGSFDCPDDAEATLVRGANMSFRRRALQQAGGFDGRFVGNAIREDFDAAYAVRSAGWRIVYRAGAALDHHDVTSGGCHGGAPYAHDSAYFRNVTLFFLKHRLYRQLLAYLLLNVASGLRHLDASHVTAVTAGTARGIRARMRCRPTVCSPVDAPTEHQGRELPDVIS